MGVFHCCCPLPFRLALQLYVAAISSPAKLKTSLDVRYFMDTLLQHWETHSETQLSFCIPVYSQGLWDSVRSRGSE